MLSNITAQTNIITAPHIALTPIINVNSPPKKAPNGNENMIEK